MEKRIIITLVLVSILLVLCLITYRSSTLGEFSVLILFILSLILPLILGSNLGIVRGFSIGAGIALAYNFFDMKVVKETFSCTDFCGIENFFFTGISLLYLLIAIIASFVSKKEK